MFKVGDKVMLNPNSPHGKPQEKLKAWFKNNKFLVVAADSSYFFLNFADPIGKGYYSERFVIYQEEDKPVIVKKQKQSLAVGELVRILPCPEHFKDSWAEASMDGMVGKVYPLIRPLGTDLKHWYIKCDFRGYVGNDYYFPSDGLQHLNTYDLLYQAAMELKIPGRGKMNKEQLKQAIIAFRGAQAPQVAAHVNKAAVEAPKGLPEPPKKPAAPVIPKEPLEIAFRKQVGNEKRKFAAGSLSTFAFETARGVRNNYIFHYCHAPMRTNMVKVVEDIYVHHISHDNPDAYAEFADWFVNESVFASVFVTKNWREASMVLNADGMSRNQIVTTQVALRQMWELQPKLHSWKWFVDKGYDKHVAFIMSNFFQLAKGVWQKCSVGNGHAIFSEGHDVKDIVKFFKDPWYCADKATVLAKDEDYGFNVFSSIAPVKGDIRLRKFIDEYSVTKVVGNGWDSTMSLSEDKIIECAEYVKGLFNA